MLQLHITDDFDLDKIERSGQCFRWKRVGKNRFFIPHGEACLVIEKQNDVYTLSCKKTEYENVWRPYFDLDRSYRDIRGRIDREKDAFLSAAAEYGAGIRILRQDPWETLVSFIISQNKNIPAIKNGVDLLCKAAGERKTGQENETWYAFPTPEAILRLSETELKACGLGYRWRYVRAAARDAAEGKLCLESLITAPEEQTLAALQAVLGVGVKVANCVSLFGLRHLDAFPVDVWMKRILENEYPSGYPRQAYSPYNGIYQQYMFFYYREAAQGAQNAASA